MDVMYWAGVNNVGAWAADIFHVTGGRMICDLPSSRKVQIVIHDHQVCMSHNVQGFGNVGAWAADMIHVRGGRVICVSDRDGAITNEKGLDIPALRRHLRAAPPFGGSLMSFPGGKCLIVLPFGICLV